MTFSGGAASLVADVAEAEVVALPELPELREFVSSRFPGVTTPNPLDMTGFTLGNGAHVIETLHAYSTSDADVVGFVWLLHESGYEWGRFFVDPLFDFQPVDGVPILLCSVDETRVAEERAATVPHVALVRGIRGLVRGVKALRLYSRSALAAPRSIGAVALGASVDEGPGRTWPYRAAIELLRDVAVPHVETLFVDADEPLAVPEGAPRYVAKIADAQHRSDVGGVLLGLRASEVPAAMKQLRRVADRAGLSQLVALQREVAPGPEVFVGIRGGTAYGQVALLGVGGYLVELLADVVARLSPVDPQVAAEMLSELRFSHILRGYRGGRAWDLEELAALVSRITLAAAQIEGLRSLEINPLALDEHGRALATDIKIVTKD